MQNKKILGVKITSTDINEVLNFVVASIKKKKKFFISTPNPEIIVQSQKDRELYKAINDSDIALPDGVGLMINERIPGRVMMVKLLELANSEKWRVYLLGSTLKVNNKSTLRVKNEYPNIKILGSHGPWLGEDAIPVSERDISLQKEVLNSINKFRPHLLFVAFGAPKQEKWVAKHLDKLRIGGAMVVGGSLDYFSGETKLPPQILSKIGLEWLWRLILEPRRIGRIFNAVILFPLLVLKEKLILRRYS